MESWLRVVYVLTFGQFLIRIGMTLVRPYFAYYIPELGVFSPEDIAFWAGLIGSISFLGQTFTVPFWGIAADRYGKKAMIIRSVIAICIVNLLMAHANSVYSLLTLRFMLGLFAGYNAAALALLVSIAPPQKIGYAVGVLQSGQLAGTLLGPVVGGVVAELWSYRAGFNIAGILGMVVFLLIVFCVYDIDNKQQQIPSEVKASAPGWKIMISKPLLIIMLAFIILTQFATQGIEPILAIFVSEVTGEERPNLTVAALILEIGRAHV